MLQWRLPHLAFVCVIGVGGCSPSSLPILPAASSLPATNAASDPASGGNAFAATITAPISPTEAYAVVARGVFGCWLGADGPLRDSHVFHGEAAPPSQGGAAEIVLHERDPALRDQRGARAFRVMFESGGPGSRIAISNIRFEGPMAERMVADVKTWAGGGTGCQLREVAPLHRPAARLFR